MKHPDFSQIPYTTLPEGEQRDVTPLDVIARWGNKIWRSRTDKYCHKTAGKVKYRDENRALLCALELHERFGTELQRAYPCEYSRGKQPHWHLTSRGEIDRSKHRPYRAYLPTGDTVIIYCGPAAPFPWNANRKRVM